MDQGRLLAADERPGPQADFQVEMEIRAENVLAQQAVLPAAAQRICDPLDGQRILARGRRRTRRRADGIPGDEHAFDHGEGVRFQHAAVHEGAGVAFVGVADQVVGRLGGRGAFATLGRWDGLGKIDRRIGELLEHRVGDSRPPSDRNGG